ncbi:MAG: DUF2207 domain-containing protein [Kamptonema sp. SIO4C4]|nr:DUF2207 domain-containing protein [Kamptonema sp. SIO4C4]
MFQVFKQLFAQEKIRRRWGYGLIAFLVALLLGVMPSIEQGVLAQDNGSTASGNGEKVLRFHSEILVNEDASLRVREEITVRSQADQIEHGIYRTISRTSPFHHSRVPLKVLNVERNGQAINYWVETQGENKRINMYDPDIDLAPGTYTYTLTYRTAKQLDFANNDNGTDRLYWNVTGQNWTFPIEEASAVVYLPDSIPTEALELQAYTGKEGEKGQNYQAYISNDGHSRFLTTLPLDKREGLSISVEFPTGYIEPNFTINYPLLDSFDQRAILLLLAIISGGCSILSYWQAVKFARKKPIYLKEKRLRWQNSSKRVNHASRPSFLWAFLGSSTLLFVVLMLISRDLQNLPLFVFLILTGEDLQTLPLVSILGWSALISLLLGFLLAKALDSPLSQLRPYYTAPNHASLYGKLMKRVDKNQVKPLLNPSEQVAWELQQIEVEGFCPVDNPNDIYLRIYDHPNRSKKYYHCPSCNEQIVSRNSTVIQHPTTQEAGKRQFTYICQGCEHQWSEEHTIPRIHHGVAVAHASAAGGGDGGAGGGGDGGGGGGDGGGGGGGGDGGAGDGGGGDGGGGA